MPVVEEIVRWFQDKGDISSGVALYCRYGNNTRFRLLLSLNHNAHASVLRLLLARIAGVRPTDFPDKDERDRFRLIYPFLADRNCPVEIKALAADKITAYWKCADLHSQLFLCNKNEDCRQTAADLVNVFIEDQLIKRELDYYKQHGGTLGEHPIFARNREADAIRKMSVRELVRRERQLRDNIWRIQSEIKKADRPHLNKSRNDRIEEKKHKLDLVASLLKD